MRVRELAEYLGASFEGDGERGIAGVAPIEAAGPSEVAFVAGRMAVQLASRSAAGCLLAPLDFPNFNRTVVRTPDPRAAFARIVPLFHPPATARPGIHPSAVIGPGAVVSESASIGPCVVVGAGTRIGGGTSVGPGCSIGADVHIGDHCVIHANVTIYDRVSIGHRAIIHAGAVLGADGFGFVLAGDHYEKFPQVGRVEIGDDVEIGANSCVDRAALGVTSIGDGTKLDNMVHVAHNCRIGKHVVVAAQTGFSGGVVVEDYAVIGGQVGIGDKARIESRAVLGSGCGVLTSKVVRSGQVVWGTPARPLKEHLELLANLGRLPRVRAELDELKDRVAALERR
ncbi:MAG: UDP-3-O-(3-hydroxymyristoyl)glucosamine N-acyltransferase [Bryobacteraceae bacterium]|nr:UDP-3-O-(3-hydroxymyristoyl)glucosamine N-acyltransferase [Bryobacteraceae bacterium]